MEDKIKTFDWNGQYVIREQFRPIAEALVAKYPELKHIRVEKILFVANTTGSGKNKDKKKLAQVATIPAKWTEILYQLTGRQFSYLMEFFTLNCNGLRREQYIALVYHELLHIGVDGKLRCHDIEDWSNMINGLGPFWNEQLSEDKDFPDLLAEDVDWDKLIGQRTVQMSIEIGTEERRLSIVK